MIDSYQFGQMVINGKEYRSDLIIFPDRVLSSWWRKEGHSLCQEDIEQILSEKPELLIIGTGYYGLMKVPQELREYIRSREIDLIIDKTKKASEVYNNLFQKKKTIAAFHLTC
ncbi:MAG: Mth938-like domain-containing protein [Candidatus Aminicenantia bacterium]